MSETAPQNMVPQGISSTSGKSKRLLWFGIIFAAVLSGAIFAMAYQYMDQVKVKMEEDLRPRQRDIAASRVETADAWLQALVAQTKRLVGSDLFQLFASEVDKLPGGVPLLFAPSGGKSADQKDQAEQLSSQLPLMRTLLSDFISYSGFTSARIVNSNAETYMATEASAQPLTDLQRSYVGQVIESAQVVYAPLIMQSKGLTLEIYVPIMPPQYQRQSNAPVAVLIAEILVDQKIVEFISPGAAAEKGREIKLIQKNRTIFQNVVPGSPSFREVTDFSLDSDNSLPFDLRDSFGGKGRVYSSGIRLRSLDWWVVVETDASLTQNALSERARTVYSLAGLLSAILVLLVSAVWWRLIGKEQGVLNEKFRELLVVIEDQKKLLDTINSTISDPISLTDTKGVYKYVNKAFASAVGRPEPEVIGLDGPAVFGFDTARRLNTSDQHVLMTGESVSVNEVLWLQSKRYNFQISKTPLRDPGTRKPQGIVSVFRDITQLVDTEERSRRMVQQTIDALVRTIEEADPFLGGHSRIMGGIATLIAKQLRLNETDIATIQASANLSQIGKMFVPREILLKPGTLTDDEKREMERHVEHARNVLKDIEFDLPVVDAIYQMNERLDGKGYPRGLQGDEISMYARILAVANAFTAMAKPRSYRPALPVNEVMNILEKQNSSYDKDVVAALRQVLITPAGERIVQQAAASKAV